MGRAANFCVFRIALAAPVLARQPLQWEGITEQRLPVHTDLAPNGYTDERTDEAYRHQIQAAFGLPYEPVLVETILGPGTEDWQSGEDVLLASSEEALEGRPHEGLYGFIFLHGAGQTSDDPTNLAFVKKLLAEMPGYAVLPQALPKFNNTVFYPEHEDEPIKSGVNAVVVPSYAAWTSFYRPDPFPCYADPTARANEFWAPVREEHLVRLRRYVRFFLEKGIPASNVYVLGFSIGAPMAQKVIVSLASEGLMLGGGIGFDGADVDQIASAATFAKVSSPAPMLYFMYSQPPTVSAPWAACLKGYSGLELQLLSVRTADEIIPHGVYLELLSATFLWLRALGDKRSQACEVEAAWQAGLKEIHGTKILL